MMRLGCPTYTLVLPKPIDISAGCENIFLEIHSQQRICFIILFLDKFAITVTDII